MKESLIQSIWETHVEPSFQDFSLKLHHLISSKQYSNDCRPLHQSIGILNSLVFQLRFNKQEAEDLLSRQYFAIVRFLENQEMTCLYDILLVYKGLSLICRWFNIIFYHTQLLLNTDLIPSQFLTCFYLQKKQNILIELFSEEWQKILEDRFVDKNRLQQICFMMNETSPSMVNTLTFLLSHQTIRFYKPIVENTSVQDYPALVVRIYNTQKEQFQFYWGEKKTKFFIQLLTRVWILPFIEQQTNPFQVWFDAIPHSDVRLLKDVATFYSLAGIPTWWDSHSSYFSKRWNQIGFKELIHEIKLHEKLSKEVEILRWKLVLRNDINRLFQSKPDILYNIMEEIHFTIMKQEPIEFWLNLIAFSSQKDVIFSLYHNYLKQRLFGEDCSLEKEGDYIKDMRIFFGDSLCLNLNLMLKERIDVATNGCIDWIRISKVAWDMKNPYSFVKPPAFLIFERDLPSSCKEEYLFHVGMVHLMYGYHPEQMVKMLPIQALVLLSIQGDFEFEMKGLETVLTGLEKDGLIEKQQQQWKICSFLPRIKECSPIPTQISFTTVLSDQNGHVNVVEDFHVDAFLVSMLKKHKSLSHTHLLAQFKKHWDQLDTTLFKQRVHALIQREYIERDPAQPSVYRYIP